MRLSYTFFFVMAFALQTQLNEVGAVCNSGHYPCDWDMTGTCKGICNSCPSEPAVKKRCQSVSRACMLSVSTQWVSTCTGIDIINCDGDTEQRCIRPEPAFEICYKPGGRTNCATVQTNLRNCHLAGCVWCGNDAVNIRKNNCWEMPTGALCTTGESCCFNQHVLPTNTPTINNCDNNGGHICTDSQGITYCNFGPAPPITTIPPTLPPTTTFPGCPTDNVEDCSAGTTQLLCEDLCCTWCIENNVEVCKTTLYGSQCDTILSLCLTKDLGDCPSCKSHGCEWCGPDIDTAQCIASTSCTSCNCPERVVCCAQTAAACAIKGCLWCDDATDFKCMNLDSSGITQAGVWTYCTRTCGCGSQWQYNTGCTKDNFYMCPRIFRSCNTEPCPTDICAEGEMNRHVESGSCCMDHVTTCGRNPYNVFPDLLSVSRKKRIVGGSEINMIENWPWLAVIYVNGTKLCTGTILGDEYVITWEGCVNGQDPADVEIDFGHYDRAMVPSVTRTAISVITSGDIAIIMVAKVALGPAVFPICLPGGEVPLQDTDCIIAGWGKLNSTDPSCVVKARAVDVRILPMSLCELEWGDDVVLTVDLICAGIPEGGKDACWGDEGGPLMCQRCKNCGWYLYGIATGHIGCGLDRPTMYAKIPNYEDWITGTGNVPVLDPGPYSCV